VSPPRKEHEQPSQLLDSDQFVCPICNEALPSEAAVSRHIDDAHGEVMGSAQKITGKSKEVAISDEDVESPKKKKKKKKDDESVGAGEVEDEEEETEKRKIRGDDDEEEEEEKEKEKESRQITDAPASDGDDFEDDKKRKSTSTTSEQVALQRAKIRRLQKKGKRVRVNRNAFLDTEAEVSGDDEGDEEEGDSDVEMLSQYEDDAAHATPDADAVSPSTMRGIYLYASRSTECWLEF